MKITIGGFHDLKSGVSIAYINNKRVSVKEIQLGLN